MAKRRSKGGSHKGGSHADSHGPRQRRAMKPTWEGHLRLSLVTCPVALYSATERTSDIRFNLINPKTNNRIKMLTVDAGTGDPVERKELVKGYAISKNQYILFDPEELEAMRLESTRIIDIEDFVPASTIDRIYWDEPYYLAPSGKTGIEAYAVIQEAMNKQKKVALGRLVMHQRERICALEPRGEGILLTTLRTADEIRSAEEVFDRDLPKPDPKMLSIAEKIIEQQEAKFDPSQFKDRYEDALRDLIERKKKGEKIVSAEEPEEEEKVVDLMEALRKSLKGGGGPSREKADRFLEAHAKRKPAKKKAAAKRRAA